MVVLSASICTRGGKALLSRQFRDISRDRITALLANFPSLISNSSGQHTSVEDENVRYVYQPLEEFYIVLITNKTSNILQDIDTLHLFASTVSNLLRNIDEREFLNHHLKSLMHLMKLLVWDIKKLDIDSSSNILEMDSHEEKSKKSLSVTKNWKPPKKEKEEPKKYKEKKWQERPWINYIWVPVPELGLHHLVMIVIKQSSTYLSTYTRC